MELKLKLMHRGLILVCVPLLFELGIVLTLLAQTHQLEVELTKGKQVKKFMDKVTETARALLKADGSVFPSQQDPTEARFEKLEEGRRELPRLFREVREAAVNQSLKDRGEELLVPIEKRKTEMIDACREIILQRLLIRQAAGPSEFTSQLDNFWYTCMGEYMVASGDFGVGLSDKLRMILDPVKDLQAASPKVQQRLRDQQKLFLLGALVASFVLALQLAVFFSTSIVRRLLTITDNTMRLKDGRELNPAIGGKDEIALLDSVFHEMTVALRESQEKERQMLNKLMIAEARVRSIIENMPVGVILLDNSGKIESINPRIEELFHCEAPQLVQKDIGLLFENPGADISFISRLLNLGQGKKTDLTALSADGSKFFAEIVINEVETFEGNRFLLSIQDVTDRHELERIKQEFYAMIAHDLRTPLMSAQMSLGVVTDGALGEISPQVKTTLERAETGITRLTNLINDFLDFEKLQSGKFDLLLKPMYLSSLLERSVSEVQGLANKYGLKIEIPDEEAVTFADEERLIQVLINLLSNAIKFSPENETIKIEAKTDEKEILVSVVDRGPGIPQEQQDNLFKSFSMLKNKNKSNTRIKGTGLGLAICKMIVEQHGGSIGVKSKEGEGSTFWFKIPIKSA